MNFLNQMAELSHELQRRVKKAGFVDNGHVTRDGAREVSRRAKVRGLMDWADTRSPEDYRKLIELFEP